MQFIMAHGQVLLSCLLSLLLVISEAMGLSGKTQANGVLDWLINAIKSTGSKPLGQ